MVDEVCTTFPLQVSLVIRKVIFNESKNKKDRGRGILVPDRRGYGSEELQN